MECPKSHLDEDKYKGILDGFASGETCVEEHQKWMFACGEVQICRGMSEWRGGIVIVVDEEPIERKMW